MQRLQGEVGEMVRARQGHSAGGAGQISEVLGRISGHGEKTRELNLQLEQLRSDHQEVARATLEKDDLGNCVLEEVQRIITREDTVVTLRGHFEPSIRSVEAHLEQVRKTMTTFWRPN